ncbi:hypothetical protein WIS52_12735 [Pseudonocardia nematodicida]|uniref:Uncharacterized protein n=1 Tax=Pseudonocardia nematodicida TaxID=1206997 RepID=A0ABV1KBV3_9PSEU
MIEAARLSRENRARALRLDARYTALAARVDLETDAHDLRRMNIYYSALVPFCEVFLQLKNVELSDLDRISLPGPVRTTAVAGSPGARVSGLHGLAATASGAAFGAGAGSAAYAGVGAFAAASTGTPIASLSGAAASNATLAWLGGGTLAAGGGGIAAGTMVLTGLVAAPAVLAGTGYVAWKGRRDVRDQRAAAARLTEQESELSREEQRCEAVVERSMLLRTVLAELQDHVTRRLDGFAALVARDRDFATYPSTDRESVMELVRLVSTATTVMATSPADGSGSVSTCSRRTVDEARQVIADLTVTYETDGVGSAA